MLKRIDDIEIPSDNPFANDLLDRRTVAENLATLVENTTTPYVMSISAPWGQGKTTCSRIRINVGDAEEPKTNRVQVMR